MTTMKPVSQCSLDEIDEQVRVRLDLMKQMVGSLYPSILNNEIRALRQRQRDAKNQSARDVG